MRESEELGPDSNLGTFGKDGLRRSRNDRKRFVVGSSLDEQTPSVPWSWYDYWEGRH